jgi:hypothetical protein
MKTKSTGVMLANLLGTCWIVFALSSGPAFCQKQASLAAEAAPLPGTNLPTRKLGPSDLIAISVYGAPELTRTVRLSEKVRPACYAEAADQANGLLPAEIN